jgi:hypothetical protein
MEIVDLGRNFRRAKLITNQLKGEADIERSLQEGACRDLETELCKWIDHQMESSERAVEAARIKLNSVSAFIERGLEDVLRAETRSRLAGDLRKFVGELDGAAWRAVIEIKQAAEATLVYDTLPLSYHSFERSHIWTEPKRVQMRKIYREFVSELHEWNKKFKVRFAQQQQIKKRTPDGLADQLAALAPD